MSDRRVAKRYAAALLLLVGNKDAALQAAASLELVIETLDMAPGFSALLSHPFIAREKQEKLLSEAFSAALTQDLMNFLGLLLVKKRISELPAIVEIFGELARSQAGVARATVSSVVPLDEAAKQKLAKALAKKLEKEIEIVTEQDASLLGGFSMEAEGRLFDGSLRGQLAAIMEELNSN
jgi:F-type H+-transporting ATPase subunit delta